MSTIIDGTTGINQPSTSGALIVANAVTTNEAVALGQADGRYAALAGLNTQVFRAANAVGANDVVALSQADGRYTLSGADSSSANFLTFGVNTLLTAAMSGKTIRATAAVTFTLPNATLGLSYEIYPYNYTITVTPQASGSLYLPDNSSTGSGVPYTLTLASGAYGTSYIIETLDGANWRLRTVGRTIIANAVNANEALPLGQADGRYGQLAVHNQWSHSQSVSVTALSVVSNAIATDLSLSNNFSVTLQSTTGQTLSNPVNMVPGTSGQIAITQNATPSTLSYDTYWISTDGTTMAVSTTANAVNLLTFYVVDSTHIWFSVAKHGVV